MSIGALEFVQSFGPTPLDELTSRISADPEQVATEINKLRDEGLLEVTDSNGNAMRGITESQAGSSSKIVKLTSKGLKLAFAR